MSAPARAVPFFCPFCGEESLRPWGDDPDKGHGTWRCEDCARVFVLPNPSGLNASFPGFADKLPWFEALRHFSDGLTEEN